MHVCIYPCKNIIGGLNIGDFIQKSLIAKVYSSPIFYLNIYGNSITVLYITCIFQVSEQNIQGAHYK